MLRVTNAVVSSSRCCPAFFAFFLRTKWKYAAMLRKLIITASTFQAIMAATQ